MFRVQSQIYSSRDSHIDTPVFKKSLSSKHSFQGHIHNIVLKQHCNPLGIIPAAIYWPQKLQNHMPELW